MTTSVFPIIYFFHETSGMPGFPFIARFPRIPSINMADPTAAIMAALSVQSAIGGT